MKTFKLCRQWSGQNQTITIEMGFARFRESNLLTDGTLAFENLSLLLNLSHLYLKKG
jgi:hypothetical protein